MKYLFICLLVVAARPAAAQPMRTSSMNSTTINTKKDVVIAETNIAGPVTVQHSSVVTTGKLTFSNTTIELDEVTLQCDELEFAPSVTNVHCKGSVKINCRKILRTGGPTIVWSATDEATLNFTVKTSLPAAAAMSFLWSNDFKVNLAQR